MTIAKEDILDAVSKMSVMDVCELVKMMENKSKWHYWNQITNQEYKNSLLSLESKQ